MREQEIVRPTAVLEDRRRPVEVDGAQIRRFAKDLRDLSPAFGVSRVHEAPIDRLLRTVSLVLVENPL